MAALEHAPDQVLSDAEIGDTYVQSLSPAERNAHGRHYTPTMLADELWCMVRRQWTRSAAPAPVPGEIRDPACGAGALLLPPLREHLRAVEGDDPEMIIKDAASLIRGSDVDETAVWIGNLVLAAELLPFLAATPASRRPAAPTMLEVGDGLGTFSTRPAVVLMNPPYGRVRLAPEEADAFAHVLSGHPNLYALFMANAVDHLSPEGVLGALVPTSFLGGAYFRKLRAHLASTSPLQAITMIDDRSTVFATGVLQETCLAVFARGRHRRRVAVRRRVASATSDVGTVPTARTDEPWLLPRSDGDGRMLARAALMEDRLATYGWSVSTGPLVWNRHRAQLSSVRSPGAVPVIWAADLRDGTIRLNDRRAEHRWFQPGEDDALLLTEPAILVKRTTSPEQPRRLAVAELDRTTLDQLGGAVVVENHVNVMNPRPGAVSRDVLMRLLCSSALDRLFRCMTGSVAVSAYELRALPLPPRSVLHRLSDAGSTSVETVIASIYGLADDRVSADC